MTKEILQRAERFSARERALVWNALCDKVNALREAIGRGDEAKPEAPSEGEQRFMQALRDDAAVLDTLAAEFE